MGGAYVAQAEGVDAIGWNPAGTRLVQAAGLDRRVPLDALLRGDERFPRHVQHPESRPSFGSIATR